MSRPSTLELVELAQTFAALGDPRRVEIISRLRNEGTLSLSELCIGAKVTRQAVSKHLKTLCAAELVSSEKSGRVTHFSLEAEKFESANEFLNDMALRWDHTLTS